MTLIVGFDLDDTLYDESTYVDSGLAAVASYGESRYGWPSAESLEMLRGILAREGRGKVFDLWLESHGVRGRGAVEACVDTYRHHIPHLELAPAAERVLDALEGVVPLYLVTDGHKVVQAHKVAALDLERRFRRVFITNRFGRVNAKPSTYCFEKIRAAERCNWDRIVYVGDDPAKDFVGLNKVGAQTVRVRTGRYRDVVAREGFEANHRVSTLDALLPLLTQLEATPT